MKWKRICAGVSAGALAAACVIAPYDPVPVHADFGSFVGAYDYVAGLSGSELAEVVALPGGAWLIGVYYGIKICTENPLSVGDSFDMSSMSVYTGYYRTASGAEPKMGAVLTGGSLVYSADSGGFVFALSDDFRLKILGDSGAIPQFSMQYSSYSVSGILAFYWASPYTATIINDYPSGLISGSYTVPQPGSSRSIMCSLSYSGTAADLYAVSLSQLFGRIGNDVRTPILHSGAVHGNFPPGTLDPANPDVYVQEVLRPYVETNYPDIVYLLPDKPWEPQYPSETIVGIPKDWTIENPQLPTAPDLTIEIPTADFDSIDPVEHLEPFTDGMGFWWALTSWLLDVTHTKSFVILALIVGVIGFVIWRLGR